jgi:hypothetical protein
MFAVLGSLETLCDVSKEAAKLANVRKPVSVGFEVTDSGIGVFATGGTRKQRKREAYEATHALRATLTFYKGKCTLTPELENPDIKLAFASPEKFNAMVDGSGSAFPSKGITKLPFLLGRFLPLTKVLEKYLRASADDLADKEFFAASTTLMLHTIASALAQVANHDEIGRFSADHVVDGDIWFGVKDGPAATLRVKDHVFTAIKDPTYRPRAVMEFESLELARDLFDGKVNALACIGTGQIAMRGMISMLDNLNRLLDRVALYLS